MGCPKSKFPYAVKNQKIRKKLYFIPFEYIIFPHSRQKDLSIYRISRLVMSIFNRFFDDHLNRLSKINFFFNFLKFDFD